MTVQDKVQLGCLLILIMAFHNREARRRCSCRYGCPSGAIGDGDYLALGHLRYGRSDGGRGASRAASAVEG
ncbi:hypothetical protein EV126DRAFT_435106 [Verticillium dahliae]|nr:hypothetical protein EV126DRAFT_435106 [Verticillium dahliae]